MIFSGGSDRRETENLDLQRIKDQGSHWHRLQADEATWSLCRPPDGRILLSSDVGRRPVVVLKTRVQRLVVPDRGQTGGSLTNRRRERENGFERTPRPLAQEKGGRESASRREKEAWWWRVACGLSLSLSLSATPIIPLCAPPCRPQSGCYATVPSPIADVPRLLTQPTYFCCRILPLRRPSFT